MSGPTFISQGPLTITQNSVISFTVWGAVTISTSNVFLSVSLAAINSQTGQLTGFCGYSGYSTSTPLTTTLTSYSHSCTTGFDITNTPVYMYVGAYISPRAVKKTISAELGIEGATYGNYDSYVTLPQLPPSISGITPDNGPPGTTVSISGSSFGSIQGSVTFNGIWASVSSWTDTAISATVPSGVTPGSNPVIVTTYNGVASNSVNFTVPTPPAISSLSPNSGSPGVPVTITGTAFGSSQGSSTVGFNGALASPTSWSDTSIIVLVPVNATTGPVVVQTANGTSNSLMFTVPPTIGAISPTTGGAGTFITITGSGFGPVAGSNTVTVNGVGAYISNWNATTVVATIPSNASTGPVVVTVNGAASNGVDFTFTATGTISGMVTQAGGGAVAGATVEALQSGTVKASATTAADGSYSLTSLAQGTYTVSAFPNTFLSASEAGITVKAGQTTIVNLAVGAPIISSLSPPAGTVGTSVVIAGSNFGALQGSSIVSFNGVPAVPTSWSDTAIAAPVPVNVTSGPVVVTVASIPSNGVMFTVGSGTIIGTVTQASDGSAIAGASVAVLQSNTVVATVTTAPDGTFSVAPLNPASYDLRVSASGFGTALQTGVLVTAGGNTQSNVSLTTAGTLSGTVTKSDGVTPIEGAMVTVLQGADVIATATTDGSGNYSIATLAAGSYSGQASADGYNNQSQINISITAGQTTTQNFILAGQSLITYSYDALGRLIGTSDSQTNSVVYNYDAVGNLLSTSQNPSSQVTIVGFDPQGGLVGTSVSISGTGFSPTANQNTISFNGTTANITSATATQIVAVVPAGATTGQISVTTPSGSATSSNVFTVTTTSTIGSPPTIAGFVPTVGSAGTPVTINGSGFQSVTTENNVKFSIRMADVSSANSTSITTSVPESAGSGKISVATPYGEAVSTSDFFIPPSPHTAADVGYTGRMTIGGTTTVTIGTAGQIGLVLFDGTAGQEVSVNLTNSTFSPCITSVSILNPDGSTLTSYGCVNTTAFINTQTLSVTGTYTILVQPNSTTTGSITVKLNSVTDQTGTITADGSPVQVELTTPGQNAIFTFDGTVGQRVSTNFTNANFGGCWNVWLLSPDGSTLNSGATCGGSIFLDAVNLPLTGTYTVKVDPQQGQTGNVTVTLYTVTDLTGTITADGTPVSVSLSTPGENEYLTFSGTAGQQVSVETTNSTFGNCSLTVSILDSSGGVIASNGCIGSSGFVDTVALSNDGTYTVKVDPNGPATGSTTVMLYSPVDVNGSITATGSPQTVTFTTPGQNASMTFTATAGQKISLQVSNVSVSNSQVSIKNPTLGPLSAGQNYSIKMDYYQGGVSSTAELEWSSPSTPKEIIPQSQLTPPNGSAGTGLEGDYYDESYLSGGPNLVRTDPTVNFQWNGSSPGGSLSGYTFSARWTGQVQAQYSEQYTFCTNTDDGARLWVNGILVIDHWVNQSLTEWCSGTPTNLAGPVSVSTSGGYIDTVTIPVTGTYTILVDPQGAATGSVTLTLNTVPADDTNTTTPGGGPVTINTATPGQNASVTFNGTVGQRISLQMTGVSISSSKVSIQNPTLGPLVTGQSYPIEMDYFQGGGGSAAHLKWTSPSTLEQVIPQSQLYPPGSQTAAGLEGDYFNNQTLSGTPSLTRTDPTVDFDWNGSSPGGSVSGSSFSARWTGQVQAQYSEQYTFCTTTDDGARLWVNGILVIDHWSGQSPTEWCSTTTNLAAPVSVGTGGGYIDTLTIPVTGTYTIPVDPQGAAMGGMTLTLNNVPPDPTSSITLNGPSTAITTTTPGQNAEVTFSGNSGQLVTIQLTNNTIGCVAISLLPPGGGTAIVTTNQCGASFNLAQQTLPTTGTYTIYIDPNGANTGGITVAATSP